MFANKVVIVTGGSAGIGAATVELFAKEGASVAVVGRNETKLKEVAKRCEELGAKSLLIKADISKTEEAKTVVQKTVDKFGKLDVLVNNAGILRLSGLGDPDYLDTYDEVMNTNLRPVAFITSLAVPYLKETKGNIVNVSSIASTYTKVQKFTPYAMSKAAMDHFTRGAATELAPFGIRVNCVNPGPVITGIAASAGLGDKLTLEKTNANTALGRSSEPAEIGDLIVYLASNKAKGITGSCVVSDNGVLVKSDASMTWNQ